MPTAISTSGLTKNFGSTRALDGLDLSVKAGEVHGFLGPNGAGKTTTIRVLLGLLRADSGHVELLGKDPWHDAVELHRRLAYVPGEVSLWPNLTGGEVIDTFGRLRGDLNRRRRDDLLERFQLGGSMTDLFFATSFRMMALIATGFAIGSALRVRSEETSMRADLVLATPVSRWRFAASHLAVACAGSVALLAVAGLATGLTYGLAGGGMQSVPRLFVAAIVYAPAMWIMAGLAVALDGLVPRLVGVSWAILAACVVVGFLGSVLGLPGWLQDLSPFEQVPQLPAASLTLLPLVVMSAVAAGLTLIGLTGLRRRDIGRI
jgi:putative exporter of polyketide antibiotics